MNETIIRKWGNSAAVIIPAEVLKAKRLQIGDEVVVTLAKRNNNLRLAFGALKGKLDITAQEFKDEARRGWEKH